MINFNMQREDKKCDFKFNNKIMFIITCEPNLNLHLTITLHKKHQPTRLHLCSCIKAMLVKLSTANVGRKVFAFYLQRILWRNYFSVLQCLFLNDIGVPPNKPIQTILVLRIISNIPKPREPISILIKMDVQSEVNPV